MIATYVLLLMMMQRLDQYHSSPGSSDVEDFMERYHSNEHDTEVSCHDDSVIVISTQESDTGQYFIILAGMHALIQ